MVDPLIAKRVQLVGLDVDGVMTDGGVYVGTGLAVAVAHVMPEVLAVADYTTDASGGRGAVREFATELVRARGQWEDVVQRHLAERGDPVARGTDAG